MLKTNITNRPNFVRRQSLRNEIGMTLIEVSISLLISGIGLLSLAQLFGVAATLNINNQTNVQVARAAQDALETAKSQSFSTLAAGTTTSTYKSLYTVTKAIENVGLGLKRVTITVTQKANTVKVGSGKTSVFVSYISDPDATEGPLYKKTALTSNGGSSSPTPTATPNSTPTPTPTPAPEPTPTPTPMPTPTPTPMPSNACTSGQRPSWTDCTCVSPMWVRNNGKCQ